MLRAAVLALLGFLTMQTWPSRAGASQTTTTQTIATQTIATHTSAPSGPGGGTAWALLVGVSEYPGLPSTRQLRGPRADVQVVQRTLRASRKDWGDIVVLADGVSNSRGVPTRAAILQAFARLERAIGAGDFIVVYFAGHGSQQPAADPREPDGLDEIFLPRDIGTWDGRVGHVRNAITDNEIDELLDRLLAKGAQVWAIFDTCHSGTLNRGGGALLADRELARWVRPVELGIPLLPTDQRTAENERTGEPTVVHAAKGATAAAATPTAGRSGLVVFSAAQASETTPELRLPPGDPARLYRGLFTYVLAESLSDAGARTYEQLAQAILSHYAAMNRISPTPSFDGELAGALPLNAGPVARTAREQRKPPRIYGPQTCSPAIATEPCNGAAGAPADAALRERVERALGAARSPHRVTDPELADVSLFVRGGRVWLVAPLDDYGADRRLPPSFLPAASDDRALAARIAAYVEPMATARWLYGLGAGVSPALSVEVRARNCASADGDALDLAGKPRRLVAGTALCIALRNAGPTPVDLTLLHLSEDYSIAAVFPMRGESNRLAPTQGRTLRLEVVASGAASLDRLMVLAVGTEPDALASDFSWAAQAGIPADAVLRSGAPARDPVWIRTLRWIAVPAGKAPPPTDRP